MADVHRLGGLIAEVGKTDAERQDLRVRVGRFILEGSDVPVRDEVSASNPNPVRRDARDVLLDEVYALIQGLIADRDTLSVEQQLDTLSVQLGSAIATASYSDIHRERLFKRAKSRMRHSCDVTARFLATKGDV